MSRGPHLRPPRAIAVTKGGIRVKQPPLEALRDKVDSRYSLVVCAAKRARQILDGAEPTVEIDSNKPVTIALYELMADKLSYERSAL